MKLAQNFQTSIVVSACTSRIAQDPNAYWDQETLTVLGSQFSISPRIITIPAYDPRFYPNITHPNLDITKVISLFVESIGPGYRITTRVVDTGLTGGTPVVPTTWGKTKLKY